MKYIKLFLVYSILGFILETLLSVYSNIPYNSGILKGPFTFIYGIGIFIIMGLDYLTKKIKNKKLRKIIYFIVITIILAGLEYSAGIIIFKTTGKIYWNYDNLPFCFNHYISLFTSLFFGIGAYITNYYIAPKINKYIYNIPNYITLFLLGTFIVDVYKYIF